MENINVVVTSSGVSLKEVLTKEVVKALNEEASIYMNYEIPEVKLAGNTPSGKKIAELEEGQNLEKRKADYDRR